MTMATNALFLLTAALYVSASVLFLAHLFGVTRIPRALALAPRILGVATVCHAIQILVVAFVTSSCPVMSTHFAMSVVSVLVSALYLFLRVRFRVEVIGAFVAPFALTFLMASRFVRNDGGQDASPAVTSVLLPIHILVNLMGEALFLLAFAAAILYLLQENRLKAKRLEGVFRRLPPLEALDRAEHKFLLAGFPLLTIGIVTGTIWARRVEAGSPAETWRALFGYVSWGLFAGVLLLRAAAGWRGRRAAYGTIAGFGFALLVLVLYLLRSASMAPADWVNAS